MRDNTSGICFYFEHAELKTELRKQIDKINETIASFEAELPELKGKLTALEKEGQGRSRTYDEQEAQLRAREHTMEYLRSRKHYLDFYAAHLPPSVIMLTRNDVESLGFVESGDIIQGMAKAYEKKAAW